MLDLGHEPLAGECVVERLGELPPETSNTENCENPDIPVFRKRLRGFSRQ